MLHDQDSFIAQHTTQRVPALLDHMVIDPSGWGRGDGAQGEVGIVISTRQLSGVVCCGIEGHSVFNYLSLEVVHREVLRDLARDGESMKPFSSCDA